MQLTVKRQHTKVPKFSGLVFRDAISSPQIFSQSHHESLAGSSSLPSLAIVKCPSVMLLNHLKTARYNWNFTSTLQGSIQFTYIRNTSLFKKTYNNETRIPSRTFSFCSFTKGNLPGFFINTHF